MTRINRLTCITIDNGYRNMYQRAYNVHASNNDILNLENIMQNTPISDGSYSIAKTTVANTLANVVNLETIPHNRTPVFIPNGWSTPRLRFILEVEDEINGQCKVSIISGYTEYSDLSMSDHIDPNMKFYINNISVMYKTILADGSIRYMPSQHFNVMADMFGNMQYEELDSYGNKLIRPKDVVEDMLATNEFGNSYANVINTTGTITSNNVHTSSKVNNNSVGYLTKTIDAYLTGKRLASVSHSDLDILKEASAQVTEPNIYSIGFIKLLSNLTHSTNVVSFTLNNLAQLDPTVSNRVTLITHNTGYGYRDVNVLSNVTDSEDILNPTIETMKVSELVFSVGSIMVENLFDKLGFSISNASGQLVVIPTTAASILQTYGVPANIINNYINRAMTAISTLLCPKLTDNGATLVELHYSSELSGDTVVSISLNGQMPIVYRYPTFADSLFTPVVTNSATKDDVSSTFQLLFDATTVLPQTYSNPYGYTAV